MDPRSGSADRRSHQALARLQPHLTWVALLIYSLLAVGVFAGVWANPAGAWIGDNKDPKLFIWYLGWIPHQLSQWHNPLVTDYLSYPPGVNLMWNTSLVFPALVLWPITATLGPVVAYNLLMTGSAALSAWLGFMASRRFVAGRAQGAFAGRAQGAFRTPLICLFAGFLYGFSPGMMAQSTGHPHAMIGLFPPIALLLGHEILVLQRFRPALMGGLAGLAAALQLLTGEEVLATNALIVVLGAAMVALFHRSSVAEKLPYVIKAATAALLCFAILAIYPLTVQFFGPQRVFGNVQPQDVYVSDLLAFIVPNHVWLHNGATAGIVSHFTGNSTEDNAYVGLPLLVLFVFGLAAGWRRPSVRWAGLLTLLIAVLSLGPHLHVFGWTTPLWLPWTAVAKLPLMGNADPSRLMLVAFLGIGIVVGDLLARTALTPRSGRLAASLLVAGLVAVVPAIPATTTPTSVPSFFQSGGAVAGIPAGSVVLVTPFSSRQSTDAMNWQTVAQYRFRMPEGDAFTPGPYLGPHPSHLQASLDALDQGRVVAVSPSERAEALRDLAAFGVGTIVVGPSRGRDAIVSYLMAVLGSPPMETGGVDVWWHLPLAS
ncbi:MAG TPA: hypothetical protein VGU71_15620 [Candidatus Dormibacteraeota bacterium]|nr:hypothetical protein [Candidatus Dormibacteraeota bacterium]